MAGTAPRFNSYGGRCSSNLLGYPPDQKAFLLRKAAITVPRRHLPEDPLGREHDKPGAFGLCGVDEEGLREVLAVEVAGSDKGIVYASLLRELLDRDLKEVRLVVSDDQEGIRLPFLASCPGYSGSVARCIFSAAC